MLLSWKKCLLILTPPLTLLITLVLIHLIQQHLRVTSNSTQVKSRAQPPSSQQQQIHLSRSNHTSPPDLASKLMIGENFERIAAVKSMAPSEMISSNQSTTTATSNSQQPPRPPRSRQIVASLETITNNRSNHNLLLAPSSVVSGGGQNDRPLRISNNSTTSISTSTAVTPAATNSSMGPSESDSSQSKSEAQLEQQERERLERMPIDINLNNNNYLLYNRCSSRVSVKMNEKTSKALLSAKQQQLFGKQTRANSKQSQISSRIKLLSTIISVESVRDFSYRKNQTGAKTDGTGDYVTGEQAASGKASNPVRLRANLTELYICFNERGKLEARVSSQLS